VAIAVSEASLPTATTRYPGWKLLPPFTKSHVIVEYSGRHHLASRAIGSSDSYRFLACIRNVAFYILLMRRRGWPAVAELRRRPPAVSPVIDLLRSYDAVLRRAEELPLVVWLRSRPAGASVLSRWWRLPRLTLGTSIHVRHHVLRSVDALARAYAAREALGDPDEISAHERQALTEFRASVRPVPWKWIIAAIVAGALVIGRGIAELLTSWLRLLAFGLAQELDARESEQLRALVDGLLALSSSLSASSLEQTVRHLADADLKVVLILLASLAAAVYIVLRPFSAPFRIKRMLGQLG
jgi:hypothetical protein